LQAFETLMQSLPQSLLQADPTATVRLPANEPEAQSAGLEPPAAPKIELPIKRDLPKVGRNDPCPCGSGKKFKSCCGRTA